MRLNRRGEGGSVLALVPAGFLVLILLAALAVDSAVAYQAQARLRDALSAAANDSVSAGLSDSSFYSGGIVILDPVTVAEAVCRSIAAQDLASLHDLRIAVAVGGDSVTVGGSASVDAVFGRALPGFGTRAVRATAGATIEPGPTVPPAARAPAPPATSVVHCPAASERLAAAAGSAAGAGADLPVGG